MVFILRYVCCKQRASGELHLYAGRRRSTGHACQKGVCNSPAASRTVGRTHVLSVVVVVVLLILLLCCCCCRLPGSFCKLNSPCSLVR